MITRFLLSFVACLMLLPVGQAGAQSKLASKETVPTVILAGMTAYKEKGPEEAVKAWIKGSPIDGSKEALSQGTLLRQIQDFYGPYQDFEIVQSHSISSRLRTIYLVMNFEKGPVFGKFLVYKTDGAEILTSFTLNTKSENVFPASLQD